MASRRWSAACCVVEGQSGVLVADVVVFWCCCDGLVSWCCGGGGGVGGRLLAEEVDSCCCGFVVCVGSVFVGGFRFDLSRPARFLSSSICERLPFSMLLSSSSSELSSSCSSLEVLGVVVGVETAVSRCVVRDLVLVVESCRFCCCVVGG